MMRAQSIAAVLSLFVVAVALVIVFNSPGKVTLQYDNPPGEGLSFYSTGFAPWGVRAALAGLAAIGGVVLAILLADRFGNGWQAIGLLISMSAFSWIADYSRDYRGMWEERAETASNYVVVSYGPSSFVANVAAIGALASIALTIWIVLVTLRRRRKAASS